MDPLNGHLERRTCCAGHRRHGGRHGGRQAPERACYAGFVGEIELVGSKTIGAGRAK